MQSIEQIRRTNELSKVLRSHGLANDGFDAMERANEIIMDHPDDSFKPSESGAVVADGAATQKLKNLERAKHMLTNRVDDLNTQVSELQGVLKNVMQRLDANDTTIRNLKQASQQSAAQNQAFYNQAVQEPQPIPEPTPRQPAQPAANRPVDRNGVSPADVAIDKIFYCGQK